MGARSCPDDWRFLHAPDGRSQVTLSALSRRRRIAAFTGPADGTAQQRTAQRRTPGLKGGTWTAQRRYLLTAGPPTVAFAKFKYRCSSTAFQVPQFKSRCPLLRSPLFAQSSVCSRQPQAPLETEQGASRERARHSASGIGNAVLRV